MSPGKGMAAKTGQLPLPLSPAALRTLLEPPPEPAEPCRATLRLHCRACGYGVTRQYRCQQRCAECPARAQARARRLRRVLPAVPLRHFTLSLPRGMRSRLDASGPLVGRLARLFVAELFSLYRGRVAVQASAVMECGAVTVVHRTGAALDRNVHLHVVALDGVYTEIDGRVAFHPADRGPSGPELRRIGTRVASWLAQRATTEKRRADTVRSDGERREARPAPDTERGARRVEIADDRPPRPHSPSPSPSPSPTPGSPLAAPPPSPATNAPSQHAPTRVDVAGVAVFAGSVVDPHDRGHVARLAHYVVRPEVALNAFEAGPSGTVRYRFAHPAADGATHVELSHTALGARLAAIGAVQRAGRVGYHGALAPPAAARWRSSPKQLMLINERETSPPPRSAGASRDRVRNSASTQDHGGAWRCPTCTRPLTVIAVDEHDQLIRADRRAVPRRPAA